MKKNDVVTWIFITVFNTEMQRIEHRQFATVS